MKKVVFLSPHFDDLAYSCSGLLSAKLELTVINIFTSSKYAPNLLTHDSNIISQIRALEDRSFCSSYNLPFINLGFPDSSLRGFTDTTETQSTPAQDPITSQVHEKLKTTLQNMDFDTLVCPLGIGNHIDHCIVFEFIRNNMMEKPVLFYEDLPYCCQYDKDTIVNLIWNKLQPGIQPICIPVNIPAKKRNILNYTSQYQDTTTDLILQYAECTGYETFWTITPEHAGIG